MNKQLINKVYEFYYKYDFYSLLDEFGSFDSSSAIQEIEAALTSDPAGMIEYLRTFEHRKGKAAARKLIAMIEVSKEGR